MSPRRQALELVGHHAGVQDITFVEAVAGVDENLVACQVMGL